MLEYSARKNNVNIVWPFFSPTPTVYVPLATVTIPASFQQQPRWVILLQASLCQARPDPVPDHDPAHPLLVLLPRTTRGQPHTLNTIILSSVFCVTHWQLNSQLLAKVFVFGAKLLCIVSWMCYSLCSWTVAVSCQIESCWWTPSSSWLSTMERYDSWLFNKLSIKNVILNA